MVNVEMADRKSQALSSSGLACLARVPTVNITRGCAHGCVYCYGQGYRQYPGPDRVVVYGNTAEQVSEELRRKRTKPRAVYFCPSCDAFQPILEVLDQSYRTMKVLLEHGVGVSLATKGVVPDRFITLFATHANLVSAQVGLACLDQSVMRIIEPGAASVAQRIDNVSQLLEAGVAVTVRADPMIHGLTDGHPEISGLLETCSDLGVKDVAASYLFLRPAIRAGLRRGIQDQELLRRILDPYEQCEKLAMRGGASGGIALPASIRREGFERIRDLGERLGIALHMCGCKNPDLTNDRCNLAGSESQEPVTTPDSPLPLLEPPTERQLGTPGNLSRASPKQEPWSCR